MNMHVCRNVIMVCEKWFEVSVGCVVDRTPRSR